MANMGKGTIYNDNTSEYFLLFYFSKTYKLLHYLSFWVNITYKQESYFLNILKNICFAGYKMVPRAAYCGWLSDNYWLHESAGLK